MTGEVPLPFENIFQQQLYHFPGVLIVAVVDLVVVTCGRSCHVGNLGLYCRERVIGAIRGNGFWAVWCWGKFLDDLDADMIIDKYSSRGITSGQ